jgi:ABC-type multidrug transport system fused ATPase/permease subunit
MVLRMLQSYYAGDPVTLPDSSPGYFVSRIYDETAAASKAIFMTAGGFCVSAATLIAALSLSLYLSWRLTLTLGCVVPLLTFIARRFSPQVSNASQVATEEEARVREHLGRVVEAYRTVRIFCLQRFATLTTSARLQRSLSSAYEKTRVVKTYEMVSQILFSLAEASVFVGCGYGVVRGYLTLGALFALMSSFWKVMSSGRALVAQYPELIALIAQIERIAEFEGVAAPVEPSQPAANLVEIENVTLSYGQKTVLSDFSFTISPTQRVLVLGANGTGKSTLVKAITGLVAANHGVLRRIPADRISALITPFSFLPGTLQEHVEYQQLSSEKRALFETLTEHFGLAGKCQTDIAYSFSEGEKKKAQIIITLLKDASLYILDEPLANLDVNMKEVAMRWIKQLTSDKALVMILHGDEQYYRFFDHVIHLQAGGAKPVVSSAHRRSSLRASANGAVSASAAAR